MLWEAIWQVSGLMKTLILQKNFSIAVKFLCTGNNLLLPGVKTNQTSAANEAVFYSKLDAKYLNSLLLWLELSYSSDKAIANNSFILVWLCSFR